MTTEERVVEYLNDPNTKVYINENDELGYTTFAIVVAESQGFWLNAFDTMEEAREYVKKNNLTLI